MSWLREVKIQKSAGSLTDKADAGYAGTIAAAASEGLV